MDGPMGEVPQLPGNLKGQLDQLNRLVQEIQLGLKGLGQDPADDWLPPWKKPINQDNVQEILDALYWRENFPGGFRPSSSALRIGGVELTQSTQYYNLYGQGSGLDSDNMIPLVAGKELVLRAYVERRPGAMVSAPVRFDGVVRYKGKELKALNGSRPSQAASALRRNIYNDSLNFRIPAADCHGKLTFTIRVFDALDPTSVFNRASYTITTSFYEIPRMKVTGVLVNFMGNSQNLAAPTGVDLVNSLGRFLPMFPIQGFDYNVCTVTSSSEDLTVKKGWDNLLNTIANMRSTSTVRTFYVGLLPANTSALIGASQRGIGRLGTAIAAADDTRALAHELGHGCMFDHVDAGGAPGPFDTKYPNYGSFPFGSIGEQGVNTAQLTIFDPQSDYDFMTYMDAGSPPPAFPSGSWISPYFYRRMMSFLKTTDGTADILIIGAIVAVGAMVLNFRVYRDGRVEIMPSYPVSAVPIVRDIRPETDVMVDLYDREGRLVDSHRCHRHNPYQDPDGPYLDYHEVLPWREEIGEIQVARGRETIDRFRVGEGALAVRVRGMRRLEQEAAEDLARFEWSLEQGEEGSRAAAGGPAALVRYTNDGGRTWQTLAADLREERLLVNLDLLPGGEECRFQVVVSNGLAAGTAESESFVVRRKPIQTVIVSPKNGETYRAGDPIAFAGGGHSPDSGTAPDEATLWSDSLDGSLGAGQHLVRSDLQPGSHRVTLSIVDEHHGEATASVWFRVLENERDQEDCL